MNVEFSDALILDEKEEARRDPFLDAVGGVLNIDAPFPDAPAFGAVFRRAHCESAVLTHHEHFRVRFRSGLNWVSDILLLVMAVSSAPEMNTMNLTR